MEHHSAQAMQQPKTQPSPEQAEVHSAAQQDLPSVQVEPSPQAHQHPEPIQ